jgi:hypothetical protein
MTRYYDTKTGKAVIAWQSPATPQEEALFAHMPEDWRRDCIECLGVSRPGHWKMRSNSTHKFNLRMGNWLVEDTSGRRLNIVPVSEFNRRYTRTAPEPADPTPGWQQRLDEELAQLEARYDKLAAFLLTDAFLDLPEAEKIDLRLQQAAMTSYLQVLVRRHWRAKGVELGDTNTAPEL